MYTWIQLHSPFRPYLRLSIFVKIFLLIKIFLFVVRLWGVQVNRIEIGRIGGRMLKFHEYADP